MHNIYKWAIVVVKLVVAPNAERQLGNKKKGRKRRKRFLSAMKNTKLSFCGALVIFHLAVEQMKQLKRNLRNAELSDLMKMR